MGDYSKKSYCTTIARGGGDWVNKKNKDVHWLEQRKITKWPGHWCNHCNNTVGEECYLWEDTISDK